MEGISGIVSEEETFMGRSLYPAACRAMTKDVNAAVKGAFEAGATEIVINDSHFKGLNIDPEELDPKCRLIRGMPLPIMISGLDESFQATFLVGYHAKKGTLFGTLDHTDNSRLTSVRINGKEIGEIGLAMTVSNRFKVPVVLVTGDKMAVEEAREYIPEIETVTTKEAMGRTCGNCISPQVVREQIYAAAKSALSKIDKMQPVVPNSPFTLDLEFLYTATADKVSALPGMERTGGRSIKFQTDDIYDIAKFLSVVGNFN
jgi:D-amino peptidase